MIYDRLIQILVRFLDVERDDLKKDTLLYTEFDLDDSDIESLIDKIDDEFSILIDKDDFTELETLQEILEYIEDSMI